MESLLALVVGALFAAGVYLLLRPSLFRTALGLIVLSSAVNLMIFSAGRLVRTQPPLIPPGARLPPAPFANPLSQALVLTAIVIGFGFTVFTLVLILRASQETGTLDPDATAAAEEDGPAEPG